VIKLGRKVIVIFFLEWKGMAVPMRTDFKHEKQGRCSWFLRSRLLFEILERCADEKAYATSVDSEKRGEVYFDYVPRLIVGTLKNTLLSQCYKSKGRGATAMPLGP